MTKTCIGIGIKLGFTPCFSNLNGFSISQKNNTVMIGKPLNKVGNVQDHVNTLKIFVKSLGVKEEEIKGIYSFLN